MGRNRKVLVVGADGTIGSALSEHLRRHGAQVLETTRRSDTISEQRHFLDLTQEVSDWCPSAEVSDVFLAAAVTSLEACENQPERCSFVNVTNTVSLTRRLVERDAFVVFLSTNLVYDGKTPSTTTDTPVAPTTEYGRQKATAENELLSCFGDNVSVVRLTKVLNKPLPLFEDWVKSLSRGQAIRPFIDMKMAPVPISFVVDVLRRVAEQRLTGIMQVSASYEVSYVEVARRLAQACKVSENLVQPVLAKQGGLTSIEPPHCTTLDTTRLRRELHLVPPDTWATISAHLNTALKTCYPL